MGKDGVRMRSSVKEIHDFAGDIVEARIKERIALNAGDEKAEDKAEKRALEKNGKDLLDLFMDHTLDKEELETMVLNFLIAGRDTVSSSDLRRKPKMNKEQGEL